MPLVTVILSFVGLLINFIIVVGVVLVHILVIVVRAVRVIDIFVLLLLALLDSSLEWDFGLEQAIDSLESFCVDHMIFDKVSF